MNECCISRFVLFVGFLGFCSFWYVLVNCAWFVFALITVIKSEAVSYKNVSLFCDVFNSYLFE